MLAEILHLQAVQPLAGLLWGKRIVVARMGDDPEFDQSIPNAFMASAPEERFWLEFVHTIVRVSFQQVWLPTCCWRSKVHECVRRKQPVASAWDRGVKPKFDYTRSH